MAKEMRAEHGTIPLQIKGKSWRNGALEAGFCLSRRLAPFVFRQADLPSRR